MDILYCFLPKSGDLPPCGLGLLNAITAEAGFDSSILDFNVEFSTTDAKQFFPEFKLNELEPFFVFEKMWNSEHARFDKLVKSWAKRIIDQSPEYVGISIFTQRNVVPAKRLIAEIKKNSDIKVIIGGPHCNKHSVQEFVDNFDVDFAVIGEGETAILKILQKEVTDTIIDSHQFGERDINENPVPNYDGLDLTRYKNSVLYITYSRSCPRSCTFCEVPDIWKTFRFKDPEKVANEINFYIDTYGITKFHFTDSLINGDMESYRKLLTKLLKIKEKHKDFQWQAFFIVRTSKQMPLQDFIDAVNSGCIIGKIGVESGSEKVRKHMKKGFSQKSLEFFMESSLKANLPLNLLMMTGYPTETEDDFQDSLNMLDNFVKYKKIIKNIRVDATGIGKNIPLWHKYGEELNINFDENNYWYNDVISVPIRYQRFFRLREHAFNLGYSILQEHDTERVKQYNKVLEMYGHKPFPEKFKNSTNWD